MRLHYRIKFRIAFVTLGTVEGYAPIDPLFKLIQSRLAFPVNPGLFSPLSVPIKLLDDRGVLLEIV